MQYQGDVKTCLPSASDLLSFNLRETAPSPLPPQDNSHMLLPCELLCSSVALHLHSPQTQACGLEGWIWSCPPISGCSENFVADPCLSKGPGRGLFPSLTLLFLLPQSVDLCNSTPTCPAQCMLRSTRATLSRWRWRLIPNPILCG